MDRGKIISERLRIPKFFCEIMDLTKRRHC